MTEEITLKVPDIGGATEVEVIEILVKPGDEIEKDTSLITLETDKASMDIPADKPGIVASILVKVGDKVAQDTPILTLVSTGSETTSLSHNAETQNESKEPKADEKIPAKKDSSTSSSPKSVDVAIPDIGGATDVDVIEVLVKVGDVVEKEQSLVTLEGDKATMDIPSPEAGTIETISIKVGDKVSQGSPILVISTLESKSNVPSEAQGDSKTHQIQSEPPITASAPQAQEPKTIVEALEHNSASASNVSAGPAVRRQARELGVDLSQIKGTGRKSRITKDDLLGYVKHKLSEKSEASGFSVPQAPRIDFSKFGEIEFKPLNKIKRLTGINVHRSWITIPHVTQFDEADITELEAFRKSEQSPAPNATKLTVLAFVTKVIFKALVKFPQFNASLDSRGEQLILKNYFNVGIAVETPNGLVVPVIKGVDKLTVLEIADKMAALSKQAREKGITPADMSGGCFTISSLGGIGGTAFTPIVNSPEVAILGLSRAVIKPVYQNNEFKPRLLLPLSLSYDHRVIDGAEAARFTRFIADNLADIRRILL